MRTFRQVDVFGSSPLGGNPVAVVHDADGVEDTVLQDFARWTNLSETTFLLPPTHPGADYRLRIFTPAEELPFAGHPTIGSAHAWLEEGGVPASVDSWCRSAVPDWSRCGVPTASPSLRRPWCGRAR